jgi:hypothetical protein
VSYLNALAAAILIGGASAGIWRVFAIDVISKRLREKLWGEGAPDTSARQWLKAWGKCPWCSGAWVTALTVLLVDLTASLPLPLLVFAGARYVTGYIGSKDEDYVSQMMEGEA